MVRLRPHHLLCVMGWRGFGYDEAFSVNFERIIAKLKSGVRVEVVEGADDVCALCPKARSGDCSPVDPGGARGIDERLIEQVKLTVGRIYASDFLIDSVRKLTPADLDSICRGCSWLSGGWCKEAFDAENAGIFDIVAPGPQEQQLREEKHLTKSRSSGMIVNVKKNIG